LSALGNSACDSAHCTLCTLYLIVGLWWRGEGIYAQITLAEKNKTLHIVIARAADIIGKKLQNIKRTKYYNGYCSISRIPLSFPVPTSATPPPPQKKQKRETQVEGGGGGWGVVVLHVLIFLSLSLTRQRGMSSV